MKKLILLCLALTFATVVSAQAGKKKTVENNKSRSGLYSASGKSSPSRGFFGGGNLFSSPRSSRPGPAATRTRSTRSRGQSRPRTHRNYH